MRLKILVTLLFFSLVLFGVNTYSPGTIAFSKWPPWPCVNCLTILFVGNSHTFGIPETIESLAAANNKKVWIQSSLIGGARFMDHLNNPESLRLLAARNWDVVVFQEQQLHIGLRREQLEEFTIRPLEKMIKELRSNGKPRIILYNTWARKNGDTFNCPRFPEVCTYDGMQSQVNSNIRWTANRFQLEIAPVGEIWTSLLKSNPKIELFSADGSHYGELGQLLSALTIYATIFDESAQSIAFEAFQSTDATQTIRDNVDRMSKSVIMENQKVRQR